MFYWDSSHLLHVKCVKLACAVKLCEPCFVVRFRVSMQAGPRCLDLSSGLTCLDRLRPGMVGLLPCIYGI